MKTIEENLLAENEKLKCELIRLANDIQNISNCGNMEAVRRITRISITLSNARYSNEPKDIQIGDKQYTVINERPALNEPYVNMFASPQSRSIQVHTEIRHLKNHKKDYRFRYCWKVI